MGISKTRLIILGAGNVSIYLTNLANRYGFEVTVIDNDQKYADPKNFPGAKHVLCREFAGCMDDLEISGKDYVAVMSRGHTYDPLCLLELMKYEEPAYVGLMGGKSRTAGVLDSLYEKGLTPERRHNINTPIGLWIGAGTPDEIALSIIAEIIGRKNGAF